MNGNKPTLTFGSLFAGIGGIDLGLERADMRCEWQVENNEFCQKILAKYWPDVARYGDVRSIGRHIGDIHTCYIPVTDVDVLAGGFPCQPHSQAGERKASQDERDLWPEFYRLIRELEPRWVMAENVLGLLSSEDGAFFGGILRDLAKAGYDARWQVLSAADFGAPHLRERVILVAYPRSSERERSAQFQTGRNQISGGRDIWPDTDRCSDVAHTLDTRQQDTRDIGAFEVPRWQESRWKQGTSGIRRSGESVMANPDFQSLEVGPCFGRDAFTQLSPLERGSDGPEWSWPTQPSMGRTTHGIPRWLDRYRWPARPGQSQEAWEAPRVVTEKKINRTARLKGLGNAVVPALAEYVGRCIMAVEAGRQAVA